MTVYERRSNRLCHGLCVDCIAYVPCGSQGRAPRLIYKGTGRGHGNLVGLRFCVEAGLGATCLRAYQGESWRHTTRGGMDGEGRRTRIELEAETADPHVLEGTIFKETLSVT